ncbi:uncharacterized protein LOC143071009 [Mytilus galloprovincialis]|uniref:uncharacterized protein LOC143071009 n=1 Tax=Mytilus galloprovincialis TaxID=29158 RepID=UPI003F7B6F9E
MYHFQNYLTKDEDLNASMETLPYMEEDSDDELIEALGLREDDGVAPLGLREDDGVVPLEEAPVQPGYTVCWDNVGKHTVARHQSRESINVMHNWALAYIAENRVPTIRKNPEPPTILAMDIPVMTFLPTKEDFLQLKNRMTVMVERILATYVKTYEEEKETAFNPIKHEKWDSSIKKSKIINIGVIDENPSSTNGVIQILDKLHAHVPYDGDKIFPLISWGDALSCERHNDAHNVRSNSGNERDRLEGLEPAIQEFHKRMLLLQDTMNKLFVGASANQKGTLTYLRNVFNHRGVKKDVSESFNKVHEFIEFVTEGYVCLMAMDKLGMEDLNDDGRTPMALHDIANDIVETVLVEPDMGVLKKDGKRKGYCLCEDESDVPNADEPMVGCENHQCPSGEWFHLSCVDLDALPSEDEKWFCSQSCRSTITDPDIDHKFEYVKAVMFEGLGHMARRDAIRENDGPAIISNWKVDMISFHNHHHPKYFILGHRLVAGVSGWLTERLKNDLIWNRTVNYRGGQRNNIEMDMMNEFLNREFKDRIDSAASALTSDVLKRHSILAGGIGNDIDKIFQYRVSSRSADYHGTGKKRNNTVDINYFVELLQKEKLVQPMGCRNFDTSVSFSCILF